MRLTLQVPKLPNLLHWGRVEAPKATPDTHRELKQEQKEVSTPPGQLKKLKFWGFIAIAKGKVTAKDGTTLTIEKDGKTLTVLTDDKTQFRRLFWGKSSLDEIRVNDEINVFGNWTDETKTTITGPYDP